MGNNIVHLAFQQRLHTNLSSTKSSTPILSYLAREVRLADFSKANHMKDDHDDTKKKKKKKHVHHPAKKKNG